MRRTHGHQLADGLPGGGAERAEQPPVMHETRAKEPGDGEDPLGVADVGDDLVRQEGYELDGVLGAAGWAEPAPFAGRGEQALGGAVRAADSGEASLEDAAVEVPRDHPVEEASSEAGLGQRLQRGWTVELGAEVTGRPDSAGCAEFVSAAVSSGSMSERGRGADVLGRTVLLRRAIDSGFTSFGSHVELETNQLVRAEMERLGAIVCKRRRIYGKAIAG